MADPADLTCCATLRVFQHHLYELSKGLRPLVLMTLPAQAAPGLVRRLATAGIAHHLHDSGGETVNLVFGRHAAVMAARRFLTARLCNLSPEHDFMLGILLGYDRDQQCLRYLERSEAGAAPPPEPTASASPIVLH